MSINTYNLSSIEHLIDGVRRKYTNDLKYGWKSNVERSYDFGHWNNTILKGSEVIGYDHNKLHHIEKHPIIKELWGHMQEILGPRKLVRAYVNGYTFGTDAYFHVDDIWLQREFGEDIASETIIIYLNKEWHRDWGGETAIIDEEDNFLASVFPARNRALIFDSKLFHSARSLTRACPALRQVLVFKTAGEQYNRPHVEWIKEKTDKIPHSGVTLFEHLYDVASIIGSIPNIPDHVVNAGLYHSIYGTEFFKDVPEVTKEEVIEQIGEKAENLVDIFCKTTNRFDSIKNNTGEWDDDTHYALLVMEMANTIEQFERSPSEAAASQLEQLDAMVRTHRAR